MGEWENWCMWASWSSVLRNLHNLNVACTKLTIFVACQWIFRPHCHPLFRWASANLNKLAGLVGQTNFPRFPSPRFSGYRPAWSLSLLCFCCKTIRRQLNYLHCLHLSFVAIFVVAAVLVLACWRSLVCEIHLVCGGINFMAKICFPFGF